MKGDPVAGEIREYVDRYFPDSPDRASAEVNLDALRWMERIARSLESGYVFTIDYGYTAAEVEAVPRRNADELPAAHRERRCAGRSGRAGHHGACLLHRARRARHEAGLETVRFETLSRTLLDAGEADQFAAALAGPDEVRRRLQLKTLLFGMGETFRTLLQRRLKNKKAPIPRGLGVNLLVVPNGTPPATFSSSGQLSSSGRPS